LSDKTVQREENGVVGMSENELAKLIVDVCFKIHKLYGPGLFESVYEEIFFYEWLKTEIPVKRQYPVPLFHEKIKMEVGCERILLSTAK
jgi:GxxExxY protein